LSYWGKLAIKLWWHLLVRIAMFVLKWVSLWVFLIGGLANASESEFDKSQRLYRENELDSALHAVDKAIEFYTRRGENDSLVFAFSHKALIYASTFGLSEAQQLMEEVMGLVNTLPDKSVGRVAAYTRLGQLRVQLYDLEAARQHFEKAEKAIDSRKPPNKYYVILYHAIGQMQLSSEHYRQAQDYAQKAYELNLHVEGKDGALMANIWQTRYFISYYDGDYNQALEDGLEFQRLIGLHYPPNHPNTGMMHNSLADVYHVLNQAEKALFHQHKAVDVHYGNYLKTGNGYTLAGAYSNLGGLYYSLNEPYLANEYLTKAKNLLEIIYGEFGPGILETLVMLANTKQQLGLVVESEKLLAQAYRLQQSYAAEETLKKAYIETCYGDFQLNQGHVAKAIGFYDKAIQNYAQMGEENAYYSLHAKADKGMALGYSNKGDEAVLEQRKALDAFRQYFPQSKSNAISFLDGISTTYHNLKQFESALAYSDSVFLNSLQLTKLPPEPSQWIPRLSYSFNSCTFLLNRVKILQGLYKQTEHRQHLVEILKIIDAYSEFFSANLYTFRSQASLIEQADMNKKLYSLGIQSCWVLSGEGKDKHYLEKAFDYAERSKALLLRLASNNLMVDASRGTSNGAMTRDHNFRMRINSLNEQYINATHQNDSLLRQMTKTMEEYRVFQDSLKVSGHEGFLAKYNMAPYRMDEIREKLLTKGETLIQYALTDESVYAFVVTAKGFHVHHADKDVLNNIKPLQNLHGLSAEQFIGPAHRLYQALVQPLEPYFDSERLFIIPDADLYYLNFELLLKHGNEKDFVQMPYLIKEYTVSYLLSASSAIRYKESKLGAAKKKALLFVPVFTQQMKNELRQALPSIAMEDQPYFFLNRQPFSLEAAMRIGKYIPNDLFIEQRAQENIFKQMAKEYSILHFGTHAEVNNISPLQSRLFFAQSLPGDTFNTDDGYLYAYEVYAMQLRSELAVLTACETGGGTIRQGEGVLSLAHSFLHAGCASVVMSLWKIDEKTNAEIISKFYEYLAKGADKREALRNAKLHFLQTNEGELSHPYFWAGLALIGDSAPVYKSHHWLYWAGGIVLFLVLGAGILFYLGNRGGK
jgi:CHAT domain-containing protein